MHRWDEGLFVINMVGSRAEVASHYPRVFLEAIRHAVIAIGLQAFSLCPNARDTAGGGVRVVLKGRVDFGNAL